MCHNERGTSRNWKAPVCFAPSLSPSWLIGLLRINVRKILDTTHELCKYEELILTTKSSAFEKTFCSLRSIIDLFLNVNVCIIQDFLGRRLFDFNHVCMMKLFFVFRL